MDKAELMIERSRQDLILKQPFYGSLLIRLEPKAVEEKDARMMGMADFATDGVHLLFYKPGVEKLTEDEVIGTLAHEVLHCALSHMFRMRNRDHKRWNAACDYPINGIVKESHLKLPADSLFDPHYEKLNAEQVYTLLEEQDKKDPKGKKARDGKVKINLIPAPADMTEEQKESLQEEWTTATIQAAIYAKQRGTLPGSLEQMIENITKTQFPWREILAAFLIQSRVAGTDWKRPSRRSFGQGVYLPNRRHEPTGNLVIAQDTSMSVSDKELSVAYAEVRGLVQQIQPNRCIIIQCDTRIVDIAEYTADTFPEDISEILIKGRGGTDFQPPFDYLEQEGITPDAFIYFTDGEAPWPREPEFPVLWAFTYEREEKPPFGEYLWLDV